MTNKNGDALRPMSKKNINEQTDRERILVNIAGLLAGELASIQALPMVKDYMATRTLRAIRFCEDIQKGDLVVCGTSVGRQQNPWIVSFVEQRGIPNDPRGCLLRAIGTENTCNYGNESFTKIVGIPEQLLWEGDKYKLSRKIHKALRAIDVHAHRFRGLEFDPEQDGVAYVFIGPHIWYMNQERPVKPYRMAIKFKSRTTIKQICNQMQEQGYGTREFEPDDGTYDGPMQGVATFTRESLTKALAASGITLKERIVKAIEDEVIPIWEAEPK